MKRTAARNASRPGSRSPERDRALFMELNTGASYAHPAKRGGKNLLSLGQLTDAQAFEVARKFHGANHLLRHFALAKRMFVNYGFNLRAASGAEADQKALKAWLHPEGLGDRRQRKEVAKLRKFVNDALLEWTVMDVALGFWMEEKKLTATLLAPEEVRYTDVFGHEVVKVLKQIDPKAMEAAGFSPAEIKRYTKGEIELSEEADEYFAVLKRERVGYGLGRPRMESLFLACEQLGGMEAGEAVLGIVARTVIRQHKIGHQITGARAGSPAHFYKPSRGTPVKNFFQNKQGLLEFTGNFDHDILLQWVDPALWNKDKWQTILERLKWWGGAVVNLYTAETLRPYLLGLLKAECEDDRELLKPWLEEVLNASFPLPCGVTVHWGKRCFVEPRVADEMMKFLVQQGPLSTETALEEAGFVPADERARKAKEDKLPKAEVMPLFDAAHGQESGGGQGRPPGTPEPD